MTTSQTTTKPEPIEGPNGHKFQDAKMVERYLLKALCNRDWAWVREVLEDADIAFPTDVDRLCRKYGCTQYTVAVMLAPTQERLFD